jgi:penicillin-binding protein 1C
VIFAGRLALPLVPLPPALFAGQNQELEFLDRTGRPLRIVRPDASPFRHQLQYAEIPWPLIEATLAAEDRRFWRHGGVDWRTTMRAAWQFIRYSRVVSGGSTITQQLIKLAAPRPRTLSTKVAEAFQALRLEQVWDKQRILAEYLNRLDYGNFNRGCAAAARFYFAKPVRDLSPAECALLAALPQAPSRLNPCSRLDRAVKRQQWILGRMREAGWLADEEFHRAMQEPLHLAAPRRAFEAPHFIDLLLASRNHALPANFSCEASDRSSNPIQTTLDLDLNHFAEETLRRHLSLLREQHVSNGAIVILDNKTGDVLGLVGSEDYFNPDAGQVNGAWAPRSAGSALKPFTYLLVLEHGATPATVVADVPAEFVTATGLYAPVNYNRHCYGPIRYRQALACSLNISAVKVLSSLGGPQPLKDLLQSCGLSTLVRPADDYGLGLTLGNAETRLLELANAYACLARLGDYQPYRLVLASPLGPQQSPFSCFSCISWYPPPSPHRVADPACAYLIADILSDNDARSLAFGAESSLRFDFPVACKTGTSSDFRDNWAFGYTPEFTVGVWVGNDDGSPMQYVSGVTGAAPILHDLFEYLRERHGTTWYAMPPNIVECWIHPVTGKRLNPPQTLDAINSAGTFHPLEDLNLPRITDALTEKFIASNLPPLESPDDYAGPARAVRLGSEYREWFASGDNWLGNRAVIEEGTNALRVLFPQPGTTVYLDSDLPRQGRRIFLRATGLENLQWHSDTLQLAREGGRQTALLSEGRHRLTVRDPLTNTQADTWIDVVLR